MASENLDFDRPWTNHRVCAKNGWIRTTCAKKARFEEMTRRRTSRTGKNEINSTCLGAKRLRSARLKMRKKSTGSHLPTNEHFWLNYYSAAENQNQLKRKFLLKALTGWSPRDIKRWKALFQSFDAFQCCSALIQKTWKTSALIRFVSDLINSDFLGISSVHNLKIQRWLALICTVLERKRSESALFSADIVGSEILGFSTLKFPKHSWTLYLIHQPLTKDQKWCNRLAVLREDRCFQIQQTTKDQNRHIPMSVQVRDHKPPMQPTSSQSWIAPSPTKDSCKPPEQAVLQHNGPAFSLSKKKNFGNVKHGLQEYWVI